MAVVWLCQLRTEKLRLELPSSLDSHTRHPRVAPTQEAFEGGGAGLKVTLDVEYATPDPNLHTALFVKLPHESDQVRTTPRRHHA